LADWSRGIVRIDWSVAAVMAFWRRDNAPVSTVPQSGRPARGSRRKAPAVACGDVSLPTTVWQCDLQEGGVASSKFACGVRGVGVRVGVEGGEGGGVYKKTCGKHPSHLACPGISCFSFPAAPATYNLPVPTSSTTHARPPPDRKTMATNSSFKESVLKELERYPLGDYGHGGV